MKRLVLRLVGRFVYIFFAGVLCWTGYGMAEFTTTPQFQSNKTLCIPLGEEPIDPPQSINAKRNSVIFPHSTHFIYKCQQCHHKWDGKSDKIQGCMTSECHDQLKAPKISLKNGKYTSEAMHYFKYAYHNSCRGCHMELKIENEKMKRAPALERKKHAFLSGPTGCVECHPK